MWSTSIKIIKFIKSCCCVLLLHGGFIYLHEHVGRIEGRRISISVDVILVTRRTDGIRLCDVVECISMAWSSVVVTCGIKIFPRLIYLWMWITGVCWIIGIAHVHSTHGLDWARVFHSSHILSSNYFHSLLYYFFLSTQPEMTSFKNSTLGAEQPMAHYAPIYTFIFEVRASSTRLR